MRLSDGRSIGWTAWGAIDGVNVLSQHHLGVAGRSMLEADAAHIAAAGVRLVEISRAGLGGSSPNPRRTAISDGDDMRQVADALDLDRPPAVGQCGGAAAVLAMAARWPDRLSSILLVSPLAPLQGPQADRYLTRSLRRWRSQMRFGFIGRLGLKSLAAAFHRDPDGFLEQIYGDAADADRMHLADPTLRAFELAALRDFYALPAEVTLAEYRAINGFWSVDLSAIQALVRIEHGQADRTAPAEMAQWLSEQLPNARLTVDPERGHFISGRAYAQLLGQLTG